MKKLLLILLFIPLFIPLFGIGQDFLQLETPIYQTYLDFDGASNYIACGSHSQPASLSYSVWVKYAAGALSTGGVISTKVDANRGISLSVTASRKVLLSIGTGKTEVEILSTGLLTYGVWHHIVGGYNSILGVGYIFIDRTSDGADLSEAIDYGTSSVVIIGKDQSNYFKGDIDKPYLFARVLDQNAVTALYGGGTPETAGYDSDAESYWDFNTIRDNYPGVQDNVGTNNGTMVGMNTGDILDHDFSTESTFDFITLPMELSPTNLIGHWKFSKKYYDGATKTFDNLASAATTYDGVSRNVPDWAENQFGWSNSAMAFDGVEDATGDYIDVGLISNNLAMWSVGFWIDDYTTSVFDWIIGSQGNRNIGLNKGGYVFYRSINNTYHTFDLPSTDVVDGNYHLLVFTADGTSINCYFDGVLNSSIVPLTTNLYFSTIGKGYTYETYKPQCTLSEVFIYDRAITAEEVKNAYNGVNFIETP